MRSRMLNLLVDELVKKIGTATPQVTSLMPVASVDHTTNTVCVTLPDGQQLCGVQAQSGYIPEPGHIATIIQNGMDLIVLPPSGPMTSTPPAATTGLVVTPGIQMLVCTWTAAPEPDVANNRGFYQIQWASDSGMTENVQSQIVAATSAVLSPLTVETWVQVRAIDQAGYAGDYCTPVAGTPGTVPVSEPADGSITSAMLADAAVTAAKLANAAVGNLALASGAVESGNIAAGAVTADTISAGAVGAAAIAAYSIDATKLAAGSVTAAAIAAGTITTAQLAAGSVTASILDANAVNGKTITGGTITGTDIQTSSSNPAVRLGPAITFGGYPAIELTDPSGDSIYLLNNGDRLSIQVDGAENMVVNGSDVGFSVPIYADTVDASSFTINTVPIPRIYTVQVSFTTDGSSLQFTVSYSCPFTPSMAVATSNHLGCKIDNVTSITASSCVIQASQITGTVLASGSSIPVTLLLG